MALNQSVQDFMGIGEHAIGEEEGVGIVRVGGTRNQLREEGRNGEVLCLGPAGSHFSHNKRTL